MVKRAVFLERSAVGLSSTCTENFLHGTCAFHYAVKVGDDDWYEVEGGGVGSSAFCGMASMSSGTKRTDINGKRDGHPKSSATRNKRTNQSLKIVGCTYKNNREILNFNVEWMRENKIYDAVKTNCQKYASVLIQYLVGPSFQMDIPFTSSNSYSYGSGSHEVSKDGYYQKSYTSGKAGIQLGYIACEVEGYSSVIDKSKDYVGSESSLARFELQVLGVGVRLEPNINTARGNTDGQYKLKVLGFGYTIGIGFAIHTPLGSFGIGRF